MKKPFMKKTAYILPSLLILMTGCFPAAEEAPAPPVIAVANNIEYLTFEVTRGEVMLDRFCTAYTVPSKEEDLSFTLNDLVITGIFVQLGDMVREGDIVAELDHGYFTDELVKVERDKTWADMQLEQLEERYSYDRSQRGVAGFQINENAYTEQRDALNAQLEILRIRKEYLEYEDNLRVLRSPMDGVVTYVTISSIGSKSVIDECVVTIADPSKQIYAIRGGDSALVNIGDILDLTIDGEAYSGRVVEQEEVGISRSVAVPEKYIVLLNNVAISEDKNATAHIIIDKVEDCLLIPKTVLKQAGARMFVYVLKDGIRSIRDIEAGLIGGTVVEVLSGLEEGELVIER